MNTGPLRIKELAIRVPMHRELGPYARETGAGHARSIVLVLDNAGWHGPAGLAIPDGISLAFLPPYSPELQPAERLWPLVDEPIANRHVASLAELDAILAARCRRLEATAVKPHTESPVKKAKSKGPDFAGLVARMKYSNLQV